MQHTIYLEAAFETLDSVAAGSKGGHNRIAGTDALPMLRREIEECHELLAVLQLVGLDARSVLCLVALHGWAWQGLAVARPALPYGFKNEAGLFERTCRTYHPHEAGVHGN